MGKKGKAFEFDRFEMDSDGYKQVLRSDGVRNDLQHRAGEIATRAAGMYDSSESIIVNADSYIGKNRAGATVIAIGADALKIESERRVLGSTIDIGR